MTAYLGIGLPVAAFLATAFGLWLRVTERRRVRYESIWDELHPAWFTFMELAKNRQFAQHKSEDEPDEDAWRQVLNEGLYEYREAWERVVALVHRFDHSPRNVARAAAFLNAALGVNSFGSDNVYLPDLPPPFEDLSRATKRSTGLLRDPLAGGTDRCGEA